jgi:hypothetical protein
MFLLGKHDEKGRLKVWDLSITDGLGEQTCEVPFISFEEIVAATDNFSLSKLLGQGGFGKVYKVNINSTVSLIASTEYVITLFSTCCNNPGALTWRQGSCC